jgi:hypothetical protein
MAALGRGVAEGGVVIEIREIIHTATEADRAWLGVLTALALYAGKKVLDATLPRGSSFRFMERFIQDRNRKNGGSDE